MESSAQTSGDRIIPIEIIREVYDKSSDSANMDPAQNLASSPGAGAGEADMSAPNSKRASLIITFEDGTTEEETALVTNLGLSPERIKKRGSQVSIVELEQDTPIRSRSHGYIPDNRMVIEEEMSEHEIEPRVMKVVQGEMEVPPKIIDVQSHITKVKSQVTEMKPKDGAVEDKEMDIQPDIMKVQTKVIKIQPEDGEVTAKEMDVQTKIIKVQSTMMELKPDVIEVPEEIMDIHPKVTKVQSQVIGMPSKVIEEHTKVINIQPNVLKLKSQVIEMQPEVKEAEGTVMGIQPNVRKVHSQVMETQSEVIKNTFVETTPNIMEIPPKVTEMESRVIEVRPNVMEVKQKVVNVSREEKDTPSKAEETFDSMAEMPNNVRKDEPNVIELDIEEIETDIGVTEVEPNEIQIEAQELERHKNGKDIPSKNLTETSPNGSPSDISWATARESSCPNSPITSSPPEFSMIAAKELFSHKDDTEVGIEQPITIQVENRNADEDKHDTSQLYPVDVDEEMAKVENIMDEDQKHSIEQSQTIDDQSINDKVLPDRTIITVRQDKQPIIRKNSIKHIKVIHPTVKDEEIKADVSDKPQDKLELATQGDLTPKKPFYAPNIPDILGTEQSQQPNGSQSNSCQSEALSVVSHLVPSHSQQEAVNGESPRPKTQHDKSQTEQTEKDPVEKPSTDKQADIPVLETNTKSSYSQETCTSKKESLTENSNICESIEQTNTIQKETSSGNNKTSESHHKEYKSKQEFCTNSDKPYEFPGHGLESNKPLITKDSHCLPPNSSILEKKFNSNSQQTSSEQRSYSNQQKISRSEERSSSSHKKSSTSEQKSFLIQRQSSISENITKQGLFSSEHQPFSNQQQISMSDQQIENSHTLFKTPADDQETSTAPSKPTTELPLSPTESFPSFHQHGPTKEFPEASLHISVPSKLPTSSEERSSNSSFKEQQSSSSEEKSYLMQKKLPTSDEKSFKTLQKCSSSEEKSFKEQHQSMVSENKSFMTQKQLFSSEQKSLSSQEQRSSSEKKSFTTQQTSSKSDQELLQKIHSSQQQSISNQSPSLVSTSFQHPSFISSDAFPKEKIPTGQQESATSDSVINNQTCQIPVNSTVPQHESTQETQIPCSVKPATYGKTPTPSLNQTSLGTNEASFSSQDKKLIANKQYPSVNTDSTVQKTSLSKEEVVSSQSHSSSIKKDSSFIVQESNRQEANFEETFPVKKVSRLASDEPNEINLNSPIQMRETVDFPAIITASATIQKDAPVSINMTTTFSPASPTLSSPRSPTGLIEIPIQREKMITAPTKPSTKPSSSQPRIIPIEIQRDTAKQSQPSKQDTANDSQSAQQDVVNPSQPSQRNMFDQSQPPQPDSFNQSQLPQMESGPHFHSFPKTSQVHVRPSTSAPDDQNQIQKEKTTSGQSPDNNFSSSEQLPRTYVRSPSTGQKRIPPDTLGNAEQVRIIPISLSDGRIIENSGSETQQINMEFTELNRKEFADENKTWDTITEKEDTSKEQRNAKAKHTNAPTKDNQTDRVIPIQLETGQTLTPVFTKLEDPEPPEWSAFHRTGNEKERIIPITITNQPAVKHPPGSSNSAQTKQTTIKSPQTEQSAGETTHSHSGDNVGQVMQQQTAASPSSETQKHHKSDSVQGKSNVSTNNSFIKTEEIITPTIVNSSKSPPVLPKTSPDSSKRPPDPLKPLPDSSKPPASSSKPPPAIQRQTSEKLSRQQEMHQQIENVESSKSSQRATRTTLSETRSLDEQFVTGRKTNHPAKTNAQIDDGDQARGRNNSTAESGKSTDQAGGRNGSTEGSGESTGQTEGRDNTTAGSRDSTDQAGGRDSTTARRLTTIRSQSVDTQPRKKSERDTRLGSYNMKRERSLQDINKDIDTIWKELQKLDSLPSSRSRLDRTGDDRLSREPSTPPPPLSEIQLVRPSWKSGSPSPNATSLRGRSSQVKTKEPITKVRTTIWDLPPQGQPRTIWDSPDCLESPNNQNPSKYPSTPVPIPRQGRSPEAMARSWDNKPQYNPVTTQHFSFLPKASPTRPGAITPTYVNSSPRSQVRSENLSPPVTSSPKVEVRRENMTPLATSTPRSAIRSDNMLPPGYQQGARADNMSPPGQQQGYRTVPINNSGPQQVNGENNKQGVKKKNLSESQPNLKSCLKTDVRSQGTSNGVSTFTRTRSESPATRASPQKQNVNFKQEPLVKVYNRNETTTAPSIPPQSNSKYGISVTNSNYGMVNFQRTEEGSTQGMIVSDNQDFEIIQKDEVFEAKEWNKKYQVLKQTNETNKTMPETNGESNSPPPPPRQKHVPIAPDVRSMVAPSSLTKDTTTSSAQLRNSMSPALGNNKATSPIPGMRITSSPSFGARKPESNSQTLGIPAKEGTVKVVQLETERHQVPVLQVKHKKQVAIGQDETRSIPIVQEKEKQYEDEEPNSNRFPTKELSPACDASTQTEIAETTEKTDKKGGCVLM